jgi:diguanylate cyclase (GGDEF)-like protein
MIDQTMRDVMSKVSTFASRNAPLRSVVNKMDRSRHSCVVVMDEDSSKGIPLGVVTERDIVRILSRQPKKLDELRAGDVMSSPPVTVLPDTSLEQALILTRARHLRHLLVVDEERRLIGIVTQTNLVQAFLQQLHHYQQKLEEAVLDRTEELEAANRQLLDLAMEDSMLAIGNRRAMEVDLNFTQSSAARYHEPYFVALLDIDFFKRYNDYYGHPMGDKALRQLADIVQSQLRESDRLYRYGGEELLILMPKVTDKQAVEIADRCRNAVSNAAIEHSDSPFKVLTISAGIAMGSDTNWEISIAAADKALYQAKEQGRNQTVLRSLNSG